ncbi:hypothetical protein [Luedemannella helvata]|uniref:Uncharacterized protein n=1 Tax=Luedemannella helvata TaxID=349315 RepID=A0ABN2KK63_9ACTN
MDGRRSYPDDSDNRWYPGDRGTSGGYGSRGYDERGYDESDEFAPPRDGSGSYSGQSRARRAAPDPTGSPLFTPEEAARFQAAQAVASQATNSRPPATYPSNSGPIIGVPAGPPPAGLNPPAAPPGSGAPAGYGGSSSGYGGSPAGAPGSPAGYGDAPGSSAGFGGASGPSGPPAGFGAHIPTQPGPRTDLTAPHELVAADVTVSPSPVVAPIRPATETVYRARRPAVAIGLTVVAVVFGLLIFRGLMISAFGPTFILPGVLSGALALSALPLLVLGLYGLVTGAAHSAETHGFRLWAKPPLAYLLVGLVFVLGAALALG